MAEYSIDRSRWITPAERRARVLVYGRSAKLHNLHQIAQKCGMNSTVLARSLQRDHVALTTLIRICDGLGCSIEYLTVR